MEEKYRLDIPGKILRWVHPELRMRQGEIQNGDKWDDELHELEWVKLIEPLTTLESIQQNRIKNSMSLSALSEMRRRESFKSKLCSACYSGDYDSCDNKVISCREVDALLKGISNGDLSSD